MTNDDAKYREWWEKLKGEMVEEMPKDGVDHSAAILIAGAILRRMLQIEQGEK